MTLFFILLCLLPLAEIWIDKLDWKKGQPNKHTLTTIYRWGIMALTCLAANLFIHLPYWRTIPLTLIFHLTFFAPLYNVIVMKQHWSYLSEKVWWDRIELWIRKLHPSAAITLIAVKLILLLTSIAIYVYGSPYNNVFKNYQP